MSFTTASGRVVYDQKEYKALFHKSIDYTELVLVNTKTNTIVSAYKTNLYGNFSAFSKAANEVCKIITQGVSLCTAKNGIPSSTPLGMTTEHSILKNDNTYQIQLYGNKQVYSALIHTKRSSINLVYDCSSVIPDNIPYIKLTDSRARGNIDLESGSNEEYIPVRSVEEIALEKDTEWLKNKKYYVVNDDETAEKLFQFLDSYKGPISFDTETTGLRINCFGKIGSQYQKDLIKYNNEHPDNPIRADKLVGIIFTVEENVSYYFPCGNRKFKNLYEDKNSPIRKRIIQNAKSRYVIGDLRDSFGDMRYYLAETPEDDITCDVILMERVRDIISKGHIVAHHGSFEWKVCWQYEIDCNLKDDTMLMHQILYKFRSTTSNSGEPSNLKYLAKVEFGIDQWELGDFFPTYSEDTGSVRGNKKKKKKSGKIDFSYMDLKGTRIYAPADGDVTLMLYHKYIKDLYENHSDQEYIYRVEVLVACAIGYMEFYGLRIDESKIMNAQESTRVNIYKQESLIRQVVNYASEKELEAFKKLEDEQSKVKDTYSKEYERVVKAAQELKDIMDADTNHPLNISSPAQMNVLFYDVLKIPPEKDNDGNPIRSVKKSVIKSLAQKKDENGNPLYPVAVYYQQFAKDNALMTKFFAALPDFMYPGGFVFPSFNQVHAATGRMSCKDPNAQQFPKSITKIVVPRDGFIEVDADYSQIEARVITAIAKNEGLAKLFADPDSDYHTLMASMMYDVDYASVTPKMRSDAKSFNFGIPYGMGFASLAILLHGNSSPESQEDARQKYEMYFKNQPNTRKMFNDIKEMASVHRYTKTQFNRYRYYSFEKSDGTFDKRLRSKALRQAGNSVIQGTAADIFKISVGRNFTYIRKNKLLGLFLIIDMIHDEQLMEINIEKLNIMRVLADIGKNMQFKLDGYPPLYIGAGVGNAWGVAKSKMNEIHPNLLEEFTKEAEKLPIFRESTEPINSIEVEDYFNKRIYEFRRDKILDYINDADNWHKEIHPAIGGLINLQFNYGRGDDPKAYKWKDGKQHTEAEFLKLNLADFIEEFKDRLVPTNGEVVSAEKFKIQTVADNTEEDVEYDDGEDGDAFDDLGMSPEEELEEMRKFKVLEENEDSYGVKIQDLISAFGICLLRNKKVCGLDVRGISKRDNDKLAGYLAGKVCGADDDSGLQVIFLKEGNIINKTGVYVRNVTPMELRRYIKGAS